MGAVHCVLHHGNATPGPRPSLNNGSGTGEEGGGGGAYDVGDNTRFICCISEGHSPNEYCKSL